MTHRQKTVAGAIGAGIGALLGALLFDTLALGPGDWGAGIGAFLGVLLAMALGAVLANLRRA